MWVVPDLCYWLLLSNGSILARTTVQHVTREDWLNEEIKEQINQFDQTVDERLDDANFVIDDPNLTNFYIDDEGPTDELPNMVVPDDAEYDDTSGGANL